MRARVLLVTLLFCCAVGVSFAQEPAPSGAAAHVQEAGNKPAESGENAEHAGGWGPVAAKAINFAILVGVLFYFLREPVSGYINGRVAKVREDLVTAANTRETATRQLAEIDAKLKALPVELQQLKTRGADEIVSERRRIEEAAEAERQRLLEHTRREIDTRLGIARRELVEHAAELAVQVASSRIRQTITPEDQTRLVDRYTQQVGADAARSGGRS